MPTSASAFALFSYSFSTHGDTDINPYVSRPQGLSSHGARGRCGGGTTETMTMAADNAASKIQKSPVGWGDDSVGDCKAQDLYLDLQLPGKKVDTEVDACSPSSGKVARENRQGLFTASLGKSVRSRFIKRPYFKN